MSNILALIKVQNLTTFRLLKIPGTVLCLDNLWKIYEINLSKPVGEITNEVRHKLHEICQIGGFILIYIKNSVYIVPAMKF